jgi:hypothetical protein
MTAKPLHWVSWWRARWSMPKICDLWADHPISANRAMVRAVRRIHCKGIGVIVLSEELDACGKVVEIEEIQSGTQQIVFCERMVWVRYKRDDGVDETAEFPDVELVWREFRDYLIQFEAPAVASDHPQLEASHWFPRPDVAGARGSFVNALPGGREDGGPNRDLRLRERLVAG